MMTQVQFTLNNGILGEIMERVKFYSKSDLGCGYNLKKLHEIVNNYDENKIDYNINDILEFYNIILYIHNECYLKKWTDVEINNIKNKCKKMNKSIGIYLSKIDDSNIEKIFIELEKNYRYYDNFFDVIEKYNVFKRISEGIFEKVIKDRYILQHVLQNKKIVTKFGNSIRNKLLEYPENAKILLDKYEIEGNNKQIYLPNELTIEDKENLIINYINSEEANLNYLRIIENIQSKKNELEISDKTRLLTKKKIKEQTEKFFKDSPGIEMRRSVAFSEKRLEQEVIIEGSGRDIKCVYDFNWIKENQDYPTLLNNFIYLFGYTDLKMRIVFTSKKSNLGLFERYIFINSKNAYKKGTAFDTLEMLSNLQIIAYNERLNSLNIRIEDIIEWFFKKYLLNEFNINEYRISIPSENSSTLEKCRTILSEMDHILKEYQLIVEDGEIDHELIEISSNPILFKDIKSMIKNKYVYANSEEYNLIEYYFFSNQCMLHYIQRIKTSYNSFFDLINNEKIKKEDYVTYAQEEINYLIENSYIIEDKEGYLNINKKEVVYIFKDLYENEVISYWKHSEEYRKAIDELINDGILCTKSSLLSHPEIDYFNYYLNKSEFNNGLDLRNRYIHGTQPSDEKAEEIHKYNYMIFLKLFILLIIKINDDLCIYDSVAYKENKEE